MPRSVSMCSAVAELGAELRHVLVDGARAAGELEAPDPLEQLLAREREAGVLHEAGEQVELLHREVERGARPRSFAGAALQLHVSERQDIGRRLGLRPPQHRLDPRDELARAERFRHVVVCAQLQAEHTVDLLVARREHDHRRLGAGADLSADLEAVDAGEPDVEHHEAERVPLELHQAILAAAHPHHPVAVALQVGAHQVADVEVVFDDEDGAVHAPPRREGR